MRCPLVLQYATLSCCVVGRAGADMEKRGVTACAARTLAAATRPLRSCLRRREGRFAPARSPECRGREGEVKEEEEFREGEAGEFACVT